MKNPLFYYTGIVITHPRIEAEEYQLSNKKFKTELSSGISIQDVQLSPLTGFHSMPQEQQTEKDPTFDTKTMQRSITAINGKSTELSCNVIDLGNKTVRIQIITQILTKMIQYNDMYKLYLSPLSKLFKK